MPITFVIVGFIFSAIGGFVCCKCYDSYKNKKKSKTIIQSDVSGQVVITNKTTIADIARRKRPHWKAK